MTSYRVPCGREKVALPPKCTEVCPVPVLCRHSDVVAPQHPCHYGPCPPCGFVCGAKLPCGHSCRATCHDPPPPAVAEFTPPHPPAMHGSKETKTKNQNGSHEMPPGLLAASNTSTSSQHEGCPPCEVRVSVPCFGDHCHREMPCHCLPYGRFSCGKECGKLLSCKQHSCDMLCHDLASEPCPPCSRSCEREAVCQHGCPQKVCHAGDCGRCNVMVRFPCHCGRTTLQHPCHILKSLRDGDMRCDKICLKPLPRCPHLCQAQCHRGACTHERKCTMETTVRCQCKRRRQKLPCYQVLEMLQRSLGKEGSYDGSHALKLLDCDSECARASQVRKKNQSNGKDNDKGHDGDMLRAVGEGSLRSRSIVPKQKQQQRYSSSLRSMHHSDSKRPFTLLLDANTRKQMARTIVLLIVCVLVVFLALALKKAMMALDRYARRTWSPVDL